jgi:hypothetical protein
MRRKITTLATGRKAQDERDLQTAVRRQCGGLKRDEARIVRGQES